MHIIPNQLLYFSTPQAGVSREHIRQRTLPAALNQRCQFSLRQRTAHITLFAARFGFPIRYRPRNTRLPLGLKT
jgi:hypothetical protein